MSLQLIKKNKTFEGETCYFKHESLSTKTEMKFSCFLPQDKLKLKHCIIWLSGLTCTEENFITKAGSQGHLAGTQTMIICPDTSPRGLNLAGEHDSYDFGSGAGFYVNATTEGYRDHYKMYDYIMELVQVIKNDFGIHKISLMGHSMGGHGALVLGLREKSQFISVSAFSPIVNPIECAWGQKAFKGYLGNDKSAWANYDATELVRSGVTRSDSLLIDQGLGDEFYPTQLLTKNLQNVCLEKGQKIEVKLREGYDHSYFYISTFIKEHLDFHINAIC